MTTTRTTNFLLTIIAVFLGMIALRPLVRPPAVHGQSASFVQIPFGLGVIPSQVNPNGSLSVPVTPTPLQGASFLDPATGNIWVYPMYTATASAATAGNEAFTWTPAFRPPTLIGTFNGPGQPISPPTATPPQ